MCKDEFFRLYFLNHCGKKLNHNASLPIEKFKKMVNIHGADHILFGSDSPWDDQKDAVDLIKKWYFKYTVPAMLVVHVVGMILLVVKL